MDRAEALVHIRGYASAGRIILTGHARDRMRQRGADFADVRHALRGARTCSNANTEETWKVTGPDRDGDDLTCVVAIEDGVVVVTVF